MAAAATVFNRASGMIVSMRGGFRIGTGTRKRALALLTLVAACAGAPLAEQRALAQDASDPNVVATTAGDVRGETIDGLHVFRGIPYAAAPVGQLRWRAPQPVQRWNDVRAAQDFGAPCWPFAEGVAGSGGAPSEDCLRLNVWTHAQAGADVPVMVWIHGGALRFGHGALPLRGAQALTAEGVVLVALNYRLGVLGFLAHEDFSAQSPRGLSGNYGILDQIAALEWVRDNIAAFGGDPDNVTIFEGGPNAWSVCYLTVSPRARGLFHRAIAQSADCLAGHPPLVDDHDATSGHAVGAALAAALEVASGTALRGIDAQTLHARTRAAPWRQAARIVYDDGEVFPGQMRTLLAHDDHHPTPLLLARQPRTERPLAIQPSEATDWWAANWRPGADRGSAHEVAAYSAYQAFDATFRAFPKQMRTAWHAGVLARYHAMHGERTWFFRFPQDQGRKDNGTGRTFHADEAQAAHLRFWANFARSGDPNGAGLPRWPAYNVNADVEAMEIGLEPKLVSIRDQIAPVLDRIDALRGLAYEELLSGDPAASEYAN